MIIFYCIYKFSLKINFKKFYKLKKFENTLKTISTIQISFEYFKIILISKLSKIVFKFK